MPSNSLALINKDIGPSDNITWVALAYTLGLSVYVYLPFPPGACLWLLGRDATVLPFASTI